VGDADDLRGGGEALQARPPPRRPRPPAARARGRRGLLGVLEGVWATRSGGPAENELSNEVIEEKSA
jgi:hypothetical protein